jgi:hypothetical protein
MVRPPVKNMSEEKMNYARKLAGCLVITLMAVTAAAQDSGPVFWPKKALSKGLYIGAGFGEGTIDLGNKQRNEEGIDFTLKSTDDSDTTTHLFLGYWILDYFGIEFGSWDFGEVEQAFDYNDTRINESGVGLARAEVGGTSFSLVGGYDFKNVQLYGKVGYLDWDQDLATRFDRPGSGQRSARRELEYSGSSMMYSVGAAWNFAPGFWFRGDLSMTDMDDDDLTAYMFSIMYDFNPLLKALPDIMY